MVDRQASNLHGRKHTALATDMSDFTEALQSGDLERLASVPKADLHNHGTLGGRLEDVRRLTGRDLPRPPDTLDGIGGLTAWSREHVHPVYRSPGGTAALVAATLMQARRDGVRVLEMSFELSLLPTLPGRAREMVELLEQVHRETAPDLDFRPEIGMKRCHDPAQLEEWLGEVIEEGHFRGIDLYGDELSRPIGEFRRIFALARSRGLKLKAHVGEFGTARDVIEAVEVLGLDAVQHGIAAARDRAAMRLLAERGVRLNVCPTSNLALGVVARLQEHPLRLLFDEGVPLSIGTDDVLLFDRGVSEEYLALYRSGCLGAEALDAIRLSALGD